MYNIKVHYNIMGAYPRLPGTRDKRSLSYMKKKLLAFLLILVLAITAIVATACTKNTERDFKQVTASVSYAGRSSQVDKLELNATIYNFVYNNYYYYQQGAMTAADYQKMLDKIDVSYKQANESLAESEAYTLMCIDELYKLVMAKGTDEEKAAATAASTVGKAYDAAARIKEIVSVLPKKDLIAAIEAYNKEMQESFDSFLEAYESEIEKSVTKHSTDNVKELTVISKPWKLTYEKGESFIENGLKVGVVYEDSTDVVTLDRDEYTVTGFSSENVSKKVEITVSFGKKSATFDVAIVDAKVSRPALPKDDEEEDAEKTEIPVLFEVDLDKRIEDVKTSDSARYKALSEAKRRLEKQMSTNYRNYEYYYLSKLKSQAVTACEEIKGKEAAGVTQAEILAEYQKRLNDQLQELELGTKEYSSAVDGTSVKTQIVHKDDKIFYVQHTLLGLSSDLKKEYDALKSEKTSHSDALWEIKKGLIDESSMYVSNPEYDKDAKCEDEDCTCISCENYTGENPGECTDENCTCEKCPNKRYLKTITYGDNKTLNAKEDGTFDILDLRAAMYEDLAAMTDASTAEERAENLKVFKKWIYMTNDDESFFTTLSDGKLGYSLSMDESDYVESFTELSRLLAYGTELQKESSDYYIVGSGVGSFGYCYTTYGIHVIMLSGYALDPNVETQALTDGMVAIPADAITDYTSYKAAENDEETATVTPAKGTIAYDIVEKLESNKKDEKIGAFKKDFYQNALKNDVEITYFEKVYQDLIEQYQN